MVVTIIGDHEARTVQQLERGVAAEEGAVGISVSGVGYDIGCGNKAVRTDLRRERGIELRGGDADEAPDAYKRLDAVLAEHGDSIRVLHRLQPIGVAMAGPDVVDPYKD